VISPPGSGRQPVLVSRRSRGAQPLRRGRRWLWTAAIGHAPGCAARTGPCRLTL